MHAYALAPPFIGKIMLLVLKYLGMKIIKEIKYVLRNKAI